jgi:hypothetical protein
MMMIARCACGRVEYEASGNPIVCLVCYCADCQAGSRAIGAIDGDGGTAYVVYRKDRVRCTRGAELLEGHKLRPSSKTCRKVASCCNAPMLMWFEDAKHWVPIYAARVCDAPPADMRICTKSSPGIPVTLMMKLVAARIAMFAP